MASLNNPFDNLTKNQISKLHELLGVHIYRYKKGQEILSTIKNENIVGIINSGYIQIIRTEYNGNEIILEELSENGVFTTFISRTNSSHCQILAKEDVEVLVIDYNRLIDPKNLKYGYFNIFLRNLFEIINDKFKETSQRVQILEKKQIRDKLLEYFNIERRKTGSRYIYVPFSFKDLADYLAVNRSAMFRELKSLKEERFIEIKDKRITLLI